MRTPNFLRMWGLKLGWSWKFKKNQDRRNARFWHRWRLLRRTCMRLPAARVAVSTRTCSPYVGPFLNKYWMSSHLNRAAKQKTVGDCLEDPISRNANFVFACFYAVIQTSLDILARRSLHTALSIAFKKWDVRAIQGTQKLSGSQHPHDRWQLNLLKSPLATLKNAPKNCPR